MRAQYIRPEIQNFRPFSLSISQYKFSSVGCPDENQPNDPITLHLNGIFILF
jgi:hypothetical protein